MEYKFKTVKNIKYFIGFSTILVIIAIGALVGKGFKQGIDFTGGMLFQLKFEKTMNDTNELDAYLKGIETKYRSLGSRKLQMAEGNTVIIRIPDFNATDAVSNESSKKQFLDELSTFQKYTVVQITSVGPTMGNELKLKAVNAVIIACIIIFLYIMLRFRFSYAMGGVVSLVHDIIIAAGFIAFTGFEIDTTFIAALLTILGYSINDTIVVYDRMRENERRHKELTLEENVDLSVQQVLGRSINTSVTVLCALITLYVFGGESLRTFTVTLLVGVTIGTYSSIFVATPVMYWTHKKTTGDKKANLVKN